MTAARLLVFTAIFASGCASTAVRPPSPATALPPDENQRLAAEKYPPGDCFYQVVFGSESTPKRAKYTHSWTAAIRVSGGTVVETLCISWMPATLDIRPARLRVEPGVNLDLPASLKGAADTGQKVVAWGPYRITPGLYHRMSVQRDWLAAGNIGYQCIDVVGEAARTGRGSDCIHAITDADPEFGRGRYPLRYYGVAASEHLVERLTSSPALPEPEVVHPEVRGLFGLDGADIEWRR